MLIPLLSRVHYPARTVVLLPQLEPLHLIVYIEGGVQSNGHNLLHVFLPLDHFGVPEHTDLVRDNSLHFPLSCGG